MMPRFFVFNFLALPDRTGDRVVFMVLFRFGVRKMVRVCEMLVVVVFVNFLC